MQLTSSNWAQGSNSSLPSQDSTMLLCLSLRPPVNDTSSVTFGVMSCLLAFYVEPLVCVVGLMLNIGCISRFCTTINSTEWCNLAPYLISLCFLDAAQLVLSCAVVILPVAEQFVRTYNFYEPSKWIYLNEITVHLVRWLMPLLLTANYGSVWTITAISVQRYRAICRPFSDSTQNPWWSVAIIVLAAFALNFIRFWEYSIEQRHLFLNFTISQLRPTALKTEIYHLLMDKLAYVLLVFLIPFVLLTLLNGRIVWSLYQSHRLLKRASRNSRMPKHHRSVFMILSIVILFYLCHTGGLLLRLTDGYRWHRRYLEQQFLNDLSNLLFNINSLLNPIVYLLFTRKFNELRKRSVISMTTHQSSNERQSLLHSLDHPRSSSFMLELPTTPRARSASASDAYRARGLRNPSYVERTQDDCLENSKLAVVQEEDVFTFPPVARRK